MVVKTAFTCPEKNFEEEHFFSKFYFFSSCSNFWQKNLGHLSGKLRWCCQSCYLRIHKSFSRKNILFWNNYIFFHRCRSTGGKFWTSAKNFRQFCENSFSRVQKKNSRKNVFLSRSEFGQNLFRLSKKNFWAGLSNLLYTCPEETFAGKSEDFLSRKIDLKRWNAEGCHGREKLKSFWRLLVRISFVPLA